MSLRERISRSSFANLVAGTLIILTGIYAVGNKDVELLKMLSLPALGWLFKELKP